MSLAADLRAAGLQVTEHRVPGRPGSFTPTGVLLHHTVGATTGDAPSLGFVISGSGSVPGPLYQLLIARSGHVHLITEGRANHAGSGSGLTSAGIPTDQGNSRLWGIGVESPGTAMDWPQPQWDATHTAARVLLQRMGQPLDRAWRHRDYTPRKIDTLYTLEQHRAAIANPSAPQPPEVPEMPAPVIIVRDTITGAMWTGDFTTRRQIASEGELEAVHLYAATAGLNVVSLDFGDDPAFLGAVRVDERG